MKMFLADLLPGYAEGYVYVLIKRRNMCYCIRISSYIFLVTWIFTVTWYNGIEKTVSVICSVARVHACLETIINSDNGTFPDKRASPQIKDNVLWDIASINPKHHVIKCIIDCHRMLLNGLYKHITWISIYVHIILLMLYTIHTNTFTSIVF